MYPVSEDYKNEIIKNNTTTRITGTLTLKNGAVVQITNSVIAKAPTIMNQCVNNSELKLGQAYQAQLDVSIYSNINRYSVYGGVIELSFGLKIGSLWENVPLGVFIVNECIRKSNDILQITALDKMDFLDDRYSGEIISGTPYVILNYIAMNHGLVLAQDREEIEALPNGTRLFEMPGSYRASTWRDVVGDLAACLAGNTIIDRTGKLYIQSFSLNVTRNITAAMRSKETIMDYLISYSSASCSKNGENIFVGTETSQDISLDDNDFLQSGTKNDTEIVLSNILEAIRPLTYTPSDISWFGDPSLDLGDLIEATGGAAADRTLIPVQKYKWIWRGPHQIVSVGKDPSLVNSQSLNDKKINNILKKTAENEITYYVYANIDAIEFGSEIETRIAKLRFTAMQKTTIKIFHEFIFDMFADLADDCSYEIHYYLDDELIAYKPYERIGGISQLSDGDDTEFSITRDLFYILRNVDPNHTYTWEVKILTHGITKTIIDINHLHITLEGQRLYGEDYFAGILEAFDELTLFDIGGMEMLPVYEGTGQDAPKVTFTQVNDYLLTENGDNLTTESGDRLIL